MASKAFEPDNPKIPKASLGRIRGLKPQIVGTMVVPSCTDDEASPITTSKARNKGGNPSMVGRVCHFSKFDDPKSMFLKPNVQRIWFYQKL